MSTAADARLESELEDAACAPGADPHLLHALGLMRAVHDDVAGAAACYGRAAAVANIFGVHLAGWPAWLIWLFVHLMYIVEFQSRVLVFIQWGFEYLTFSRGARLITGTAATDSLVKPETMGNTGDGR